jgi:hypothetical protein
MAFKTQLTIGDISVDIQSDIPLRGAKRPNIAKFTSSSGKTDICHNITAIPQPDPSLPSLCRDELDFFANAFYYPKENITAPILRLPQVRSRIDRWRPRIKDLVFEIRPASLVVFDYAENRIDQYYTPRKKKDILTARIDPHPMAKFLAPFQAVMLHSASLLIKDRVAIFVAADEGGKTTAATLASRSQILSDDQALVSRRNGRWLAHASPWGRYINAELNGELGALFLLQKSTEFNVAVLSPQDLFNFLWHEHVTTWVHMPKANKNKYFNLLFDLCRQVPAYTMKFARTFIDWEQMEDIVIKGQHNASRR